MSTKVQREFKKQMKLLEKEGKLSDGYYARRRRIGVTGGASFLFILCILWRSGILDMALGLIMSLFVGFTGYGDVVVDDATQMLHSDYDVIISYHDQTSSTDSFMNEIYLKIYSQYILNRPTHSDFYTSSQDKLEDHFNNIKTGEIVLQELYQSYKKELDTISDMLVFAVGKGENPLSKQEQQYLNALIQQQQDAHAELLSLWDEIN